MSHIYGQGVERENQLRTFKDGKMKSQVCTIINIICTYYWHEKGLRKVYMYTGHLSTRFLG